MTSLESILDTLNKKYAFIGSVLVTRDGRLLARAGDVEHPVVNDPYNLFFRDADTIANTFDFVEQASPRSLVQGTRQVAVFKVGPGVLLGTIKDDERGPLDMHRLMTQLQGELSLLFADARLA
jgi:hypothetical protein